MQNQQIQNLLSQFESLSESQIYWVEKVVEQFQKPFSFQKMSDSIIFSQEFIYTFGEALRIHHCFSSEAFSKDKFEYAMERSFQLIGIEAQLAPPGNPGHDVKVAGQRFSLKTQADQKIKIDKIHISKFMELGTGNWGDDPNDLHDLSLQFLNRLNSFENLFILRRIKKEPQLIYELVEIPKQLLSFVSQGEFEMKNTSPQYPKPGYCRVYNSNCNKIFELYFDGGSERKLQIKHLLKEYCIVHATWQFEALI